MQNDRIMIQMEADGFTVCVDEARYRFSHDMDEADYQALVGAFEHVCPTATVTLEEVY